MHPIQFYSQGDYIKKLKSQSWVLNDIDIQYIRHLTTHYSQQSLAAEHELSAVLTTLDKILKRHETLEDELSTWSRLLSPLKRIPPEILRNVFIQCLPEDGNPAMSCHEAPLLLGRVCSSWRRLAWQTPQLWDSIHIVVPDVDYIPEARREALITNFLDGLQKWLSRSKGRPLSISFIDNTILDSNSPSLSESNSHPAQEEQLSTKILTILNTYFLRWREFKIRAPIEVISLFGPTHNPLLEDLSIQTTNHLGLQSPTNSFFNTVHVMLEAPSLRRLYLGDVSLFDPNSLPYTWSSLTHLTLGSSGGYPCNRTIDLKLASTILTHCYNLESCQLFISLTSSQPFLTGDLELTRLSSFTIILSPLPGTDTPNTRILKETLLSAFFDVLHIPSLTSFTYVSSSIKASLPLIPFLKRPLRLSTLKLFLGGADSVQLSQVLALCSHVKELHLSTGASRQILPALNYVLANNKPVCPRLEVLKLDCPSPISHLPSLPSSSSFSATQAAQPSPLYLLKLSDKNLKRDISERVRFLWGRMCPGSGGKPRKKAPVFRYLELKLEMKYREDMLVKIRPLILAGLRVVFREDIVVEGYEGHAFTPRVRWEEA